MRTVKSGTLLDMTRDPRITTPECSFPECPYPAHAKTLCSAHYAQQYRGAELTPVKRWDPAKTADPWQKCALQHCTRVREHGKLCSGHKGIPYRFGISQDEYIDLMLDAVCEVCGNTEGLNMDHNHGHCPKTKGCMECFRGILCMQCNTVLGRVNDDAERLRALADFIERR
jgi:hypothetical protein